MNNVIAPVYEALSSPDDRRQLLEMNRYGLRPLSALLNHWKDNHSDGDVQTACATAIDEIED